MIVVMPNEHDARLASRFGDRSQLLTRRFAEVDQTRASDSNRHSNRFV